MGGFDGWSARRSSRRWSVPCGTRRGRSSRNVWRVAARRWWRGGSFFDSVLTGDDAYVLKWIIHDGSDADATRLPRAAAGSRAPCPHGTRGGAGPSWRPPGTGAPPAKKS